MTLKRMKNQRESTEKSSGGGASEGRWGYDENPFKLFVAHGSLVPQRHSVIE